MDVTMNRLWHELLQEAIHESDPAVVQLKIGRAERAILLRLQDSSPGPSAGEEQALFEALGTVRALRSARRLPQKPAEVTGRSQPHR
jgi:hypothetical protein